MKNLIKILLPICGATLSALPLTLVSCNPLEGYIELNKWNEEWKGGHYLESETCTLTAGVEYSCVIDYSKWEDDWKSKRPTFLYNAYINGQGVSCVAAQRAWIKKDTKWELINPENYKIYEASGFLDLLPTFTDKLSQNVQIKIDIVSTTTSNLFSFSAH